ncbi:lysoplasmalogenase [Arvimicrobium flavum]|uniref:lysoplasmalogenase n=1 Tax=Arvimicrobium flavum TaxID=3393320 RepID=UPI00237B8C0C|nr:lysoplasmalogenase [Mesorhizobium shangrilense]
MMPFGGGLDSASNGTLIFSIGAAIFYLNALDAPPNLRRTAAKALAVGFLALLALIEGGPLLLVAALAASAAGDAFLSRPGERAFLGGLAAFLVAHVLYVALFLTAGEGADFVLEHPARMVVGAVMIAATGLLLARLRVVAPSELKAPVTAYAAAILAMGLTSLTMPGPWIVLGAVCFIASDAMLAVEKFMPVPDPTLRTAMRTAVWVAYYAAQAIITLGFLLGSAS